MLTDGMSVPRFFWRIIGAPIRNPYLLACIIHDHYCYKAACLQPGPTRDKLRLQGDLLFAEMCQVLGAGSSKCQLLYRAVRIGATASRNTPAQPDYEHQPEKHAKSLGVPYGLVLQALSA